MTPPVLVYDGTCGFCSGAVRFVLKRDPGGALRFAPREGTFGRALIDRHPELGRIDSVFWVEHASAAPGSERVLTESDAALSVARYLGGIWGLLALVRFLPRPLRDAAYRFVSHRRHRLGNPLVDGYVPTPEDRERFLD